LSMIRAKELSSSMVTHDHFLNIKRMLRCDASLLKCFEEYF